MGGISGLDGIVNLAKHGFESSLVKVTWDEQAGLFIKVANPRLIQRIIPNHVRIV